MKNKLLITTALVAAFAAADVCAADRIIVENGGTGTVPAQTYNGYQAPEDDANGGVVNNKGTVTVESGTVFSNNEALTDTHDTPSEQGGAIYSEGDNAKVIIKDNVTFQGNKAYAGGAIYLNKGSDMEIGDNVKFIGNAGVCEDCNQTPRPAAGAIAIVAKEGQSTVTIGDNALFSGNEGEWAGAIKLNQSNTVLEIGENAVFENNIARGNHSLQAGAIYNKGTTTIGKGAIFRGNQVIETEGNDGTGTGGAITNQGGATLTLNGSLFENNEAVSAGGAIRNKGTMILNGDNIFTGNKLADGTLNDISNTGTITVNGNLTLDGGISDNGTIEFAEGSSLTVKAGTTTIGNTVKNSGASLSMIFANGYTPTEEGYTLVTGSLDNEFEIANAENALYTISKGASNGTYDIAKNDASTVAAKTGATGNQAAAIGALTSAKAEGNAAFNQVADDISAKLQSADPNEVKAGVDAVTAMSPEVSPMVQQTQVETAHQVFGAVGTRLSGGSITSGGEGMSSGDSVFERAAMWVQGLFNKSKLDSTSDAKGFEADSTGIAFGAEKQVTDNVKVGVGYAYTNTDIEGYLRDTDVDTHTAIVYGEYKPSQWYVNGIATYSWADYEESSTVRSADYDVDSYGLQVMSGYETGYKGFDITPEAGLRYVHIDQDGYTDSIGNHVSGDDYDILTAVIGAKVGKTYALENGMNIKPEARVAATYDLMNDDVNSVVTLANGAAYTVEGDALDRFGMEFGAGVTADLNDKVVVSVGYEGKFREDYQDHTGLLNAKYKF